MIDEFHLIMRTAYTTGSQAKIQRSISNISTESIRTKRNKTKHELICSLFVALSFFHANRSNAVADYFFFFFQFCHGFVCIIGLVTAYDIHVNFYFCSIYIVYVRHVMVAHYGLSEFLIVREIAVAMQQCAANIHIANQKLK